MRLVVPPPWPRLIPSQDQQAPEALAGQVNKCCHVSVLFWPLLEEPMLQLTDEYQPYTALALACLSQTCHDLEGGSPQVRARARYDVQASGLDWALDALSDAARPRVKAQLEELSR